MPNEADVSVSAILDFPGETTATMILTGNRLKLLNRLATVLILLFKSKFSKKRR